MIIILGEIRCLIFRSEQLSSFFLSREQLKNTTPNFGYFYRAIQGNNHYIINRTVLMGIILFFTNRTGLNIMDII